jgi:hypothetical protein
MGRYELEIRCSIQLSYERDLDSSRCQGNKPANQPPDIELCPGDPPRGIANVFRTNLTQRQAASKAAKLNLAKDI